MAIIIEFSFEIIKSDEKRKEMSIFRQFTRSTAPGREKKTYELKTRNQANTKFRTDDIVQSELGSFISRQVPRWFPRAF